MHRPLRRTLLTRSRHLSPTEGIDGKKSPNKRKIILFKQNKKIIKQILLFITIPAARRGGFCTTNRGGFFNFKFLDRSSQYERTEATKAPPPTPYDIKRLYWTLVKWVLLWSLKYIQGAAIKTDSKNHYGRTFVPRFTAERVRQLYPGGATCSSNRGAYYQ